MESAKLVAAIRTLVGKLDNPVMDAADVIRWGSPIAAFGNLCKSQLATVGLNPSNLEFVGRDGRELIGDARRFPTLTSLKLKRWADATDLDLLKIYDSYEHYFQTNPYDAWFSQLNYVIADSGCSFYGAESNACHLDLVPFATTSKWGSLSRPQKSLLFKTSGHVIADCLNSSYIDLLVLNGKSVVEAFRSEFKVGFSQIEMPEWSLPRKNHCPVKGYAYSATIREIHGVRLTRKVVLLGFNHNLQSSFGVSNAVRRSIRRWIGEQYDRAA